MITEIKEAVEILKNGGIILYPTDTIWGIGCDATNKEAVEKIYKIKRRSDSKSLVTLASDMDMICRYVKEIPEMAVQIAEISTNPVTIIYPQALVSEEGRGIAPNVVAEDGSIAIRIPMCDFCKELLKKFNKPLISTSANISGEPSPASYDEINGEIIKAADWIADPVYDNGTHKASSIIKIGMGGEIQILRQ